MDRKPDALKALCGTQRADRREPEPAGTPLEKLPRVPKGLDADGADLWRELGRELVAEGRLTTLDLLRLEMLCMAWSRLRRAGDSPKASDVETVERQLRHFGRSAKRPARRRWSPY